MPSITPEAMGRPWATIQNSILGAAASGCIHTAGASSVSVTWSDLFQCDADGFAEGEGVITADPGFVTDSEQRLSPGSPAIDAGNPLTPLGHEPAPNGCAPNLGMHGGTTLATSAPEAPHCPSDSTP